MSLRRDCFETCNEVSTTRVSGWVKHSIGRMLDPPANAVVPDSLRHNQSQTLTR
jgi:hypothetical protein